MNYLLAVSSARDAVGLNGSEGISRSQQIMTGKRDIVYLG